MYMQLLEEALGLCSPLENILGYINEAVQLSSSQMSCYEAYVRGLGTECFRTNASQIRVPGSTSTRLIPYHETRAKSSVRESILPSLASRSILNRGIERGGEASELQTWSGFRRQGLETNGLLVNRHVYLNT
jgi:hypothetical protein